MLDFIKHVTARRRDDRGASAVEYGLLIAAIAAVIALIVFALGDTVRDRFDTTCRDVAGDATGPAANCTAD